MKNSIELFNSNNELTMSSKEIAQLTNKRHDHILRDCYKLDESYYELNAPKIVYVENKGVGAVMYKEAFLTKMQCFDLLTGYDSILRIKVNRRWAELESKEQKQIPQSFAEALQLAADQAKQLELQAPKVDYYENVLQSESLITTNEIAKDLGMSAKALNKKLKELKVQYKQSGTWLLYSKHQNKGYTKSKTYTYTDREGKTQTSIHTYWTEKGREFINNLLNE